MPYALLADLVLALHIAIVLFVITGVIVIVAGNLAGWRWVNCWWFRLAHVGAIGIVVAESWLDIACPLTTLESWLRLHAGQAQHAGGFLAYWLQRLLYYDLPAWVFLLGYTLFGLLVAVVWLIFPPSSRRNAHAPAREAGPD